MHSFVDHLYIYGTISTFCFVITASLCRNNCVHGKRLDLCKGWEEEGWISDKRWKIIYLNKYCLQNILYNLAIRYIWFLLYVYWIVYVYYWSIPSGSFLRLCVSVSRWEYVFHYLHLRWCNVRVLGVGVEISWMLVWVFACVCYVCVCVWKPFVYVVLFKLFASLIRYKYLGFALAPQKKMHCIALNATCMILRSSLAQPQESRHTVATPPRHQHPYLRP